MKSFVDETGHGLCPYVEHDRVGVFIERMVRDGAMFFLLAVYEAGVGEVPEQESWGPFSQISFFSSHKYFNWEGI